jgi:hypothetical protein
MAALVSYSRQAKHAGCGLNRLLLCSAFVLLHVCSLFCELGIASVTIAQAADDQRSTRTKIPAPTLVFLAFSLGSTVVSFIITLVGASHVVKALTLAIRVRVHPDSAVAASGHALADAQAMRSEQQSSDYFEGTPLLDPHCSLLGLSPGMPEALHLRSQRFANSRHGTIGGTARPSSGAASAATPRSSGTGRADDLDRETVEVTAADQVE